MFATGHLLATTAQSDRNFRSISPTLDNNAGQILVDLDDAQPRILYSPVSIQLGRGALAFTNLKAALTRAMRKRD